MTPKFKIGDLVRVSQASVNNDWIPGKGKIVAYEHDQFRLDTGYLYPAYCLEFVNPPVQELQEGESESVNKTVKFIKVKNHIINVNFLINIKKTHYDEININLTNGEKIVISSNSQSEIDSIFENISNQLTK